MKLRNLFLTAILSLVLVLGTYTGVTAKKEEIPQVTIAVCADFKPFEYIDNDGNFAGLDIDIMNELCKIMGVKPTYVNMEFDSIIPSVRSPLADFAISAMTATVHRKKVVDFTDPYMTCKIYNPSLDMWYEEEYAIPVKLTGEYKEELNNAISHFANSGKLDEIVSKYGITKDSDGFYTYSLPEEVLNKNFNDYKISDWAKDSVSLAISNHWTSAEDFTNDYTVNISREQFCDIAYNVLRDAIGVGTVNLSDTSFEDTENTKVLYLAQEGIISGKGNGIFAPRDNLTRAEAASILCRIVRYCEHDIPEYAGEPFADDSQIANWAKNDVYTIVSAKIMSGTGDGFSPLNPYTAEQAVATLVRLFNIIK